MRYLFFILICFITLCCIAQDDVPEPPIFTNVTVDPDLGIVTLEWEPSPSENVRKYMILSDVEVEGVFQKIDSVPDTTFTYTHITPVVFERSIGYRLTAYYNDDSELTEKKYTLYLEVEFDTCRAKIELNWHNSEADEDVELYYVYDANTNSLIDSTIKDSIDIYDFETNEIFCYYIMKKTTDGTFSTSVKSCVNTNMARNPGYINADYVTAGENGFDLSFSIDEESQITTYYLLRKLSGNNIFDTISRFNSTESELEYTDENVSLDNNYVYQLVALNNCKVIIDSSNRAENIVLQTSKTDSEITLIWNAYQDWLGEVDNYDVYRCFGDDEEELLTTLPKDQLTYSDDVDILKGGGYNDRVCYVIEGHEGSGNPYGVNGVSRSNSVCLSLPVEVFIPNAFTPNGDGKNDTFRPVFDFNLKEYNLTIKDRWGGIVFTTDDPFEEWDGIHDRAGKVDQGVYIYYIKGKTESGEKFTRNGYVSIIIPNE